MTDSKAPPAPDSPTAADLVAGDLGAPSVAQRIQTVLHRYPAFSPAVVLVLSIIVFAMLNDRFLRPENLSLISQQVAVIGTLAIGQTIIILTAGIDLSVGAAMLLATMIAARTASENGLPAIAALLLGLLAGVAAGTLNGILVTRLSLPPFIVTLGTLNIFGALMLLYSAGSSVRGGDIPGLMTWTGGVIELGRTRITFGVLLMIALYIAMAFALSQTAWGRHVYAVGDDRESARLSGIAVNRVLLSVYATAGATFALAGWILMGRINAASPNAGVDANLDSITAVVIGGTSLFGGRGALWGSLIGALIVGVFRNGLSLAGLDVLYQTLTVGVLVIVAVSVDQWIRRAHA